MAMKEWSINTGVNWRIAGTFYSSIDEPKNDRNEIYFGKSKDVISGSVAHAISTNLSCTTTQTYYTKQIDIVFNSHEFTFGIGGKEPQAIKSTDMSFYAVLLHELGHAAGFNHVLNRDDVMYLNTQNGKMPTQLLSIHKDGMDQVFNYTSLTNKKNECESKMIR